MSRRSAAPSRRRGCRSWPARLPGTATALSLDWALAGVFTTAAIAGALADGRLAGRASGQRLSIAFTALIVVVAGYTLARSPPAIA